MGNPPILFCDEPTTGLDSFNAVCIMQRLKTIADSGKIVIASVHQPSSQIYSYFTDMIMICDGNLVVQGKCKEIDEFFDRFVQVTPGYSPYPQQLLIKIVHLAQDYRVQNPTIQLNSTLSR